MLKQAIIVREDLKLPKGKLAVQVAHASLEAALKTEKKLREEWIQNGAKKIVLKVTDLNELIRKTQEARDSGIKTAIITDAGKTVVQPGTTTCAAIGPDEEEKINKIIKDLKLV